LAYGINWFSLVFNPIFTSDTDIAASNNACWFNLCDAKSSFIVGPQGPTGPTGSTGPQGNTGAIGPVGGANIWYQSWDMLNYAHWGAAGSDPAPNGCGSPGMVYYHGFVAPATGIYNKLEVQIGHTTNALTATGDFVGGIYKDAGGVPSANAMLTNSQSPHDGTTGGTILTPSAPASAFVGPLTEGGVTYCNFASGASLVQGEVYWVAVKYDKPSTSGFRITLNTDETSYTPEHYKYSYMSDSAPAVADDELPDPATPVVQNIKANFWFRISGPVSSLGPMIPYEPWNQDILSNSFLSMFAGAVHCIQFRAPSTGIYNKATMLTAPIVYFSTNNIGMAIYSNLPNQGQVDGNNTHGIPNLPLTYGSSSAAITANTFYTNTLSDAAGNGVTLYADNLYWFVYSCTFSFGGPGIMFANNNYYDQNSNSNFRVTSHYNGTIFSPVTYAQLSAGGNNGAINASAWFRLSQ